MFKKKKQKQLPSEEIVEDIIETSKPLEPTTPIKDRDNPASFFDFTDEDIEEQEPVREEKPSSKKKKKRKQSGKQEEPISDDEAIITIMVGKEPWKWVNTEEYELQKEKEEKKSNRRKSKKELDKEPKSEDVEKKKELSTYFEENKEKTKKLKRVDKKALKKASKEDNEKQHRKSKKEKIQEDIKNQKVFRYDGKRYTKVEDFVTYLNEHYLDIEKISEEVLEDENFFGWVNKNSGVFSKSLEEFKKIKAKIENNS